MAQQGGEDIKSGFPPREKKVCLGTASSQSQYTKLYANWPRFWAPNRFPQPSLTLTCHTDLGASHDTHSTTSQPHDPQSCSKETQKLRNACLLTSIAQTERCDQAHGFQGGVQNGPTPPPPPSARSQISNGHISATLALFPTRVTTAAMAQHYRRNGVVLFWGIFSAILALNCVLPNNRQRLGPMSTGV